MKRSKIFESRSQTRWNRFQDGRRGQFFACWGEDREGVIVTVQPSPTNKREWVIETNGQILDSVPNFTMAKDRARSLARERGL